MSLMVYENKISAMPEIHIESSVVLQSSSAVNMWIKITPN